MSQVVIKYSGDPIVNSDVLHTLGLSKGQFTYIVATAELARIRSQLIPDQPELTFHEFIRHEMGRNNLRRSEELITLARAARDVATRDSSLRRQLEHDVTAWQGALARLDEEGLDLHIDPGATAAVEQRLVHPGVLNVLRELQAAARGRRKGRKTYEAAAFEFLRTSFALKTRHVVMEGFTFLTPLQRQFVDKCLAAGATVHFLVACRPEQAHGFAIIDRTYGTPKFTDATQRQQETSFHAEGDLLHLQQSLFTAAHPIALTEDRVVLRAYNHRHEEVAETLRTIEQYLQRGVAPHDIAIVMRDPQEFHTLLLEEADRLKLSAPLNVPPRMLLLTPVGRFVLTLYEVWDQGLYMEPDQFEAILASGWLGAALQDTTDEFSAVKAEVFTRCRTWQDWMENLRRLGSLISNLPAGSPLPAGAVRRASVTRWESAVYQLNEICKRLFSAPMQSIGEHVRLLTEELLKISPYDVRHTERHILDRILEVLKEAAEAKTLPIETTEFREILVGMAQERKTEDEGGAQRNIPGKVWVVTPEGIDGTSPRIVFYVGADNRRVPREYSNQWPFTGISIDEHQERERYYFLAVVRAAGERLYLSYSRCDRQGVYHPCMYVEEAARVLDRTTEPVVPSGIASPIAAQLSPAPTLKASPGAYPLVDVMHYGLCPNWYRLKRIDSAARHFRHPFHLRFVAVGYWLDRLFSDLERRRCSVQGADNLYNLFVDAFKETRPEVRSAFPGFRDLDWVSVETDVQGELRYLANSFGSRPYRVTVEPGNVAEYVIVDDEDDTTIVTVPVRHILRCGKIAYPIYPDLLREEWLRYGRRANPQASQFTTVQGVQVFASQHHAVKRWEEATREAYRFKEEPNAGPRDTYLAIGSELAGWVKAIEAGHYPKNPGDHCYFCPVRAYCLGL